MSINNEAAHTSRLPCARIGFKNSQRLPRGARGKFAHGNSKAQNASSARHKLALVHQDPALHKRLKARVGTAVSALTDLFVESNRLVFEYNKFI